MFFHDILQSGELFRAKQKCVQLITSRAHWKQYVRLQLLYVSLTFLAQLLKVVTRHCGSLVNITTVSSSGDANLRSNPGRFGQSLRGTLKNRFACGIQARKKYQAIFLAPYLESFSSLQPYHGTEERPGKRRL